MSKGPTVDMLDAVREAIDHSQPTLYYRVADSAQHIYKIQTSGHNPKDCTWLIPTAEMERMENTLNTVLLIMVFSGWKRDVKLERMKRYGQGKNNQRKQQLVNVKGLFKNFANELETGLKEGTPRVDMKAVKGK